MDYDYDNDHNLEGERPREPPVQVRPCPLSALMRKSGVARNTACRTHSKTAAAYAGDASCAE